MTAPARHIRLVGKAEYREEAEQLITGLGEAVVVTRGRPRSLVMRCPDGCGQIIVVNLDDRSGKAWELDLRKEGPTLYPSVWLSGGCKSHFIVWRGRILWCHRFMEDNYEPSHDPRLEVQVLGQLEAGVFKSPVVIARELDELVWDVDRCARVLVKARRIEQRKDGSGWTYGLRA